MAEATTTSIRDGLWDLGVQEGMMLAVHSSMGSLRSEPGQVIPGGPDAVVDALCGKIFPNIALSLQI